MFESLCYESCKLPHSSCLFHRLVFLTLVNRCWWTCTLPLTWTLPLVLSFSHWSATVGGHCLVRFHSSCLFDIGQPLLVDFNFCAPTRLVFFTLVSHCWWTLTCAFPLSCLFDIGQSLLVDFDLCAPIRLVFFTVLSF